MSSHSPTDALLLRRVLGVVALALAVALALLPGATASAEDPPAGPSDVGPSVATLVIPDRDTLDEVVAAGTDLDHDVEPVGSGFEVTGIVWPEEVAALEAMGVTVSVEETAAQIEANRVALMDERAETIEAAEAVAEALAVEATDTVVVARADRFTSLGDQYLSVEAKSTEEQAVDLTVEWDAGEGTEIGDGGSAELDAFVDAGEYQYHRGQFNLSGIISLEVDGIGGVEAVLAGFGSAPDTTGVSGTIELVDDNSGAPTEGCDPLVGFTAGNIALVDRGSCPFTQKVSNAQAAGAVAVIVANNDGGAPFSMGGSDSSITIPSVMVSQDDGAAIKAGLPTTGTLAAEEAVVPTRVRVTSSMGGSAEADVTEWLGEPTKDNSPTYFQGFLDHYPDVYETNEILADLHEQFPDLTDIIELPYETNGYRRNAMALSGGGTSSRVVLTSHAWGHEGGNDLTIRYVDPGATDSPLSVAVSGDDITVSLGTNAAGAVISTAAQVVAAINASPDASALVSATTYRGSSGGGVVQAGSQEMTDGLNAPEYVEREPFQPLMLRIGKHRDGSKLGVMTYSQEHAREWQTPLVNIETAYRLLHNYKTDAETKKLVNNLDIFIIPTVNPDGQLYSYYDFASQRKNMTNYCGAGDPNDFNARNAWGVDNNRNYDVGSLFDGYDGASTSCTSAVFSGPSELSEPESKNVDWVPATYDNIKFAMNIHSSGNYFMWSPGAYVVPGRETLPRPSLGTEDYFFAASEDILTEIHEWRGLTVTPARTGPIADVLYSAAGNSGDMLYYKHGLYAWNFEVGTSFQPEWDEAFNQMMEFSNGVIELYDVANDWAADRRPPESWTDPEPGNYDEPVALTFGASEPVDIYYTLDGSRPDYDSPVYESAGVREGGEEIMISSDTTVRWFSVDASGNTEKGYTPGRGNNSRKADFRIG
ncbi:M14 family zinc carboxypeptidase [Salsipaludibacter albus]|uniref:M14 family zinc carboxypeptidase n=1 Tax=Salsipaludibacter albus TaxID=2849650 RepID=UPI002368470A|nr:M14 family zinc carboxypeptidase [Salsipaludibacter albus]MBY5162699.1 chitobiase/beta-hexosaminidase C-terminal domain-containing protein [Salsipaludibacter albus]